MHDALTLNVNGREHTLAVAPETPLLTVLRNDLGLTAAKLGCGLEQCGACAVLIDGKSVLSCAAPVGQFEGRHIHTVEDGEDAALEAVFMPGESRQTICISTQAGCAVDCHFCLTATLGLIRNLSAGEIVGG